jgi:chromate transporter
MIYRESLLRITQAKHWAEGLSRMSTPISYWGLCRACVLLGLTSYGGPAMVGYVREVVVERRRWVGPKDFEEGLALCQAIPGATLTQVVSYVGLLLRGPGGAAAAAACFVLPGTLLVLILSGLYFHWQAVPLVRTLSRGVAAVAVAILAYACVRLGRAILPTLSSLGIAIAAWLAYLAGVNAFLVIVGAAGISWLTCRSREGPEVASPGGAAEGEVLGWMTWGMLGGGLIAGLLGMWMAVPGRARLCLAFLGIGSVAFGGGYSMIPLIQQQVVDSLGLVSTRVFMDGIALGQITPGPIMLTATFLGFAGWGVPGALLATLAIFLPSWVILVVAAPRFRAWSRHGLAQPMIRGVVSSFVGMLLSLLVRFGSIALTDLSSVLLTAAALTALLLGVDLPLVILAGLALSPLLL